MIRKSHPIKEIPVNLKVAKRLWNRVNVAGPDDCWEWNAKTRNSYGTLKVNGKPLLAHRVAYAVTHGSTPTDKIVRHRCDNPPCCNPAHLELGTLADNVRDMERIVMRRRQGEEHDNAVLTDPIVRAIWELRRLTGDGRSKIGKTLGVSSEAVGKVLQGKSWIHLMPEWAKELS